jgi:hypothetical protein
MSSWRIAPFTKIRKSLRLAFGILTALLVLTCASPNMAQKQGGAASASMPEITIRQRNRQMEDYDRELDRFKAAAMISAGRRRSLLRQIKEDFERIQAIHNEMLEMIQVEETLKYERLVELSSEMTKRIKRLGTNLALPAPADSKTNIPHGKHSTNKGNDADVKESFYTLHDVLVRFVTNPIFKNLKIFEANEINRASCDLNDIVLLSDKIKKSAAALRQDTIAKGQ